MAYADLLKDPRWQKKRLQILELDAWRCRHCGDDKNTLHVHHLYYEKGLDPWEYPDSALVTYCENCHKMCAEIKWQRALLDLNFTEFDLLDLASILNYRKQKGDYTHRNYIACYVCGDLFKDADDVNAYYNSSIYDDKRKYIG